MGSFQLFRISSKIFIKIPSRHTNNIAIIREDSRDLDLICSPGYREVSEMNRGDQWSRP